MEDWVVLYSPATCSKDPLPLKFTQNEYEAGQKGTGWTKFVRVRYNTTSIYSMKNSLSYHWLAHELHEIATKLILLNKIQ